MSKLKFKQINLTCPDSYIVIDTDTDCIVATVSLRYGRLRAWYLGRVIYEASVGDKWTGRFDDPEERNEHFAIIEKKLLECMEKRG